MTTNENPKIYPEVQAHAIMLIEELTEWARIYDSNTLQLKKFPSDCRRYRLNIANKLDVLMPTIRNKLLCEGKNDAAKELKKKCREFREKVLAVPKIADPNNSVYLPDRKLRKMAQDLADTLDSFTPALAWQNRDTSADLAKRRGIKRMPGWIFEKTSRLIGAIIIATIGSLIAAILIDFLGDFGLLKSIKTFIYSVFWLK